MKKTGMMVSGWVVVVVFAFASGCTPSNVEGSGSIGTADFAYAANNCQGELQGHVNINDGAADVAFHADIDSVTQQCAGCAYCADGRDQMTFTYKAKGQLGAGFACYSENLAEVSVLSGAHAGYSIAGPIENAEGGVLVPCD